MSFFERLKAKAPAEWRAYTEHAFTAGLADGKLPEAAFRTYLVQDYLFLIDFSRRQRIKLWGRARVVENDDALIEKLFDRGYKARPERVILFTIEAWDVNCSQHITARMTVPEVEGLLGTVQERIAALQAENARLQAENDALPANSPEKTSI